MSRPANFHTPATASSRSEPAMVGFGPVQADFTEGKLLKPGAPEIQSEPLGVLLLLVQRHGEIVSSYDFRRALWRDDIFVDRPPTIRAAARLFLR